MVKVEGVTKYDGLGTSVRIVNKGNPDEWVELDVDFDTNGDLEFPVTQGPSVSALRVRKETRDIPAGRYDDFNPADYDRND